MREILPAGAATPADVAELESAVREYKGVTQILKKQGDSGLWARNMLGLGPSKAQGVTGVGTIAQYRRLAELALPFDDRAYRLADRTLFRLLSRDQDPKLLFEFKKDAAKYPEYGDWARELMAQAATCALAQAGNAKDPRVRGSAHRIATAVSHFLRSDLADDPFVKKGSKWILDPEAHPPTLFSIAMMAYMPSFQRERAGLVGRLLRYLGETPTRKSWSIMFGRKTAPSTWVVMGDPLQADSRGKPKDLPFALHWLELLARLGGFEHTKVGQRILGRLLKECDETGVWDPGSLRGFAKSSSKVADFAYPLEVDSKNHEKRKADVTFRLALIAKHAGWELEYT